jgi:hypothetical protein
MPVTLTLPSPLVTPGPTYSTLINVAIQAAADATHIGGANGDKWTSASLGIDADVSWGGYSITAIKATTYTQQAAVATANSVYFKTDNNLWCTNGSGTAIQLTSGAGLNSSALITAVWPQLSVATNYTILAADAYTFFKVDTSAARAVTLPSAAAVGAGRFYVISDVTGSAVANNITISRAGADTIEGATSHVINVAYGWVILVSDGTSAWSTLSERDATSTRKGRMMLAGDIGGSAASPTVVGLTGVAGTVPLRSSVTKIEFDAAAAGCTLGIADSAGAVVNMTVRAQNAGGANNNGGTVIVAGGTNTGSGRPGGVTLNNGTGVVGLEVGAFSGSRRFVSLGTNPGSTDIPTGDGVVYIANATTNPSSNPVGGGVLYVSAGALVYRGTSGTVTTLGLA